MKRTKLTTLIFGLLFFGCNQENTKANPDQQEKVFIAVSDHEQIQSLIRQVLNWVENKNAFDLLPVLADGRNRVYTGFDLDKHKQNLAKLKQSNLFATSFIENYNQIILTLDKGMKKGNYDRWLVGNLPTFTFANGVDPWTLCQDVPYEKPNPFDFIETNILNASKGEVIWKWGKLKPKTDQSWKNFTYKFKVVKENDKWKIAYLQGFDFKKSTSKAED
ncbi:MAG: hypothetical protein EOO96_05470 [Pedobacter sp.]|nr:MAG: hypothetical protein EOO96_05470 [Pedobacter sp.]